MTATSPPRRPCRAYAHPPLSQHIDLEGHPVPGRRARAAVHQMTHCLGVGVSADSGGRDTSDTAALVATELVTNAWRHAGGAQEMRLIWDGRTLTVEVDDSGSAWPAVLAPDRRGAQGGYGLPLVDSLAEAWGTYCRPGGKTVWARCAFAARA
ncbi:ATP-binding protein [Streptomyces anandii]|uniref:ATP-binding protein n=1 Tax=Streptomyces anandii TaxID=285454 RepID=UPI001677950B|nr:ATP-binding protein [Streptomyces anandii]GGY12065.1 hypothetical protein GCM10010510_67630 [Streptomyces anandii JCM 4720]